MTTGRMKAVCKVMEVLNVVHYKRYGNDFVRVNMVIREWTKSRTVDYKMTLKQWKEVESTGVIVINKRAYY